MIRIGKFRDRLRIKIPFRQIRVFRGCVVLWLSVGFAGLECAAKASLKLCEKLGRSAGATVVGVAAYRGDRIFLVLLAKPFRPVIYDAGRRELS